MLLDEFNLHFKKFIDYYSNDKKPITKEKLSIYYMGLQDLNIQQLNNAFVKIVQNRNYANLPQIS